MVGQVMEFHKNLNYITSPLTDEALLLGETAHSLHSSGTRLKSLYSLAKADIIAAIIQNKISSSLLDECGSALKLAESL